MQKIKEYLLITIGVALTAIALEYFFFPCDISFSLNKGFSFPAQKSGPMKKTLSLNASCSVLALVDNTV